MFPSPQAALPFPARPNLERYRKLAKALVKAARADAIGPWVERWIRGCRSDDVEEFARRRMSEKPSLTSAQFVIARSHGFESWLKFSKHVEAFSRKSTSVSSFEAAADAIVAGDAATLKRLLREDPGWHWYGEKPRA